MMYIADVAFKICVLVLISKLIIDVDKLKRKERRND